MLPSLCVKVQTSFIMESVLDSTAPPVDVTPMSTPNCRPSAHPRGDSEGSPAATVYKVRGCCVGRGSSNHGDALFL